MALNYDVISLGRLNLIDTDDDDNPAERAEAILGSYGSEDQPLYDNVKSLRAGRLSEDDNDTYDHDNGGGYDTFSIDGGALQRFDEVAIYNARITYIDGTTANVTAVIFQDVNGNTYLAPEVSNNSDNAAYAAKPIRSLELQSVNRRGEDAEGDMVANRAPVDFKDDAVDGTGGGDSMQLGYTDADGDQITNSNDVIDGKGGNDTIDGAGGNDQIFGGSGNDALYGGAGSDEIYGGAGNDYIDGGAEADTTFGGAGDDTIDIGNNADVAYGGADADTFVSRGSDFNKAVYGGDTGNDRDTLSYSSSATSGDSIYVVYATNEDGTVYIRDRQTTFDDIERIEGSEFDDTFDGRNATTGIEAEGLGGADVMAGGSGNDTFYGGSGDDQMAGNGGDDRFYGGSGDDIAYGGAGQDRFYGGAGSDGFAGGSGNDLFNGGDGNDLAYGETGNDVLYADAGDDELYGGDGNDVLYGGTGNDTLNGDAGDDYIEGGSGNDTLNGGAGDDYMEGGTGDDVATGGDGADTFYGGDGRDDFEGGAGNDTGYGGADDDALRGGEGDDRLYGGSGNDFVAGGIGNDTLGGDAGDDTLQGAAGNDIVSGGDGNDVVDGNEGNDTLSGGRGDDRLTGGAGDDRFVYSEGDGKDLITDFGAGNSGGIDDGNKDNNDSIDLSGFYDTLNELRTDFDDDGVLNQSNSTANGGAVDYSNNAQFGPDGSLTFQGATRDSFTEETTHVVCYTAGTRIATVRGEIPIEALRPGDLVQTRDNGLQPLLWVGISTLDADTLDAAPNLRPILISPELVGIDRPLVVSPQHGVLLRVDGEETLVRATHLARMDGGQARVMRGCRRVTYAHLMFEHHQIVFANGAPSESLYPGEEAMKALSGPARREIYAIFPELRETVQGYGAAARDYSRFGRLPEALSELRCG